MRWRYLEIVSLLGWKFDFLLLKIWYCWYQKELVYNILHILFLLKTYFCPWRICWLHIQSTIEWIFTLYCCNIFESLVKFIFDIYFHRKIVTLCCIKKIYHPILIDVNDWLTLYSGKGIFLGININVSVMISSRLVSGTYYNL